MATNYYQDGTTMDWSNSTGKDVKSGEPVAVGQFMGVAHGDIPDGGEGVLHTTGVFVLPKVPGKKRATLYRVDHPGGVFLY